MASLFPSGPPLPDFKSLVVKGPYHASAPIHLALSHAANVPTTRILMVAPSRETMADALRDHNDDWISVHSGQGKTLELSSCTTVFYPPSPAHFAYLMSMISTDFRSPGLDPTVILDQAPSLIILIELSAYFLSDVEANPNDHPWTLSSYMTLVARTLASFAALSSTTESEAAPSDIALVLFDSQLENLKLPIVKRSLSGLNRKPPKIENVAFFVQKYFDLVAVFEEDDEMFLNSSQEDENEGMDAQRRNRMRISRRDQALEIQRWVERPDSNNGGTVFDWDV